MHNDNFINCNCSNDNIKGKIGPFGPFEAIDASQLPVSSGTSSIGQVIPFSSGDAGAFLNTGGPRTNRTAALIGFGNTYSLTVTPNSDINLTNKPTRAFSVPQAGSIIAISASYAPNTIPNINPITVRAQIYRAAADSNIFSPTNAFVDLTPINSLSSQTPVAKGIKNMTPPVQIEAGDLLMMVFTANSSGTFGINGNAMAGITLA